jgi:hypothetical protein
MRWLPLGAHEKRDPLGASGAFFGEVGGGGTARFLEKSPDFEKGSKGKCVGLGSSRERWRR